MAEKKVSVRLSATGGRQVRAELEGVGEAGSRGMGRLSREMDQANARMAAFARRAQIAAAAAAAAVAAAGVAMVRNGLSSIDAQAKLAQSLDTTVASIQVLERAGELAGVSMSGIEQATKDLTRRLSQAAAGTGPAIAALDQLGLSAVDLMAMPLDERVAAINTAIEAFVPAAQQAAVAGQLFGEEGSIAMARIDSAALRQATQDMRDFGVIVSEQDADQIEQTNDAISRLGLIWRGVSNQLAVAAAPALERVAGVLAGLARVSGPLGQAIQGLFANLERMTIYTGTFVTFLAGRWVAAMAAAALSVRGLATTLVVLRGALIRTGIGVLIVGAGELVYWFTRLASSAGGFGEAMALLKDVAVEVWDRIKMGASSVGAAATAMFYDLKADAASGMAGAIESVVSFGNTTANTFEGALLAVREIWSRLPDVIGDLVFSAANRMLDGIEAMLNGAIRRIDAFTGRIRDALAAVGIETTFGQIGEISLDDIPNPFAGASADAGTAAANAFRRAFEDNPLSAPDLGLDGIAADALETANIYRRAATDLANGATAPLTSWGALRDAVAGTGEEGAAALDEATASADRLSDAMGRAGGAAGSAGERVATGWLAVSESLQAYATDALNWGKGLGETLTGAFSGAESAFRSFVETGKFDFKGLVRSILADLAVLSFKRAVLGPIASALSGIFGCGSVAAAVSHAGGIVGLSGHSRSVPAMAFAAATRMHSGGWAGLRPDEVPTILQRGERVLNRREAADYGRGGSIGAGVTVNIDARGAQIGAAEQIDARLRAAIPEIARIAKESVADGRRRGQVI
ncbi:MAG: phage tail tape measure protein [Marivita sp.]|uniref:phage tail tape measure C-terminal domain-containing protein n=1 Tax=Marivita sp. TaxID=2003365 RepID=UPI001B147ABE|nr:phage tail tape measure C-terminal domain-containing protein [Marivita sp.]MBO6882682.1 phage tail tape measure protein [Marivita sp.]